MRKRNRWATLTITIDVTTRQQLEMLARERGVSMGSIVKNALGLHFTGQHGALSHDWRSESLLTSEVLLKRLLFYLTGRDEKLCRAEQAQIAKWVEVKLAKLQLLPSKLPPS